MSESDVYRRQIMTSTMSPRAERVKPISIQAKGLMFSQCRITVLCLLGEIAKCAR